MAEVDVRKGMPSVKLTRAEFETRFRSRFADPAFDPLARDIAAIIEAAWDGYSHSRKAPRTRKAGSEFADPDYDLAVDWLAAREGTAMNQVSATALAAVTAKAARPNVMLRMVCPLCRGSGIESGCGCHRYAIGPVLLHSQAHTRL